MICPTHTLGSEPDLMRGRTIKMVQFGYRVPYEQIVRWIEHERQFSGVSGIDDGDVASTFKIDRLLITFDGLSVRRCPPIAAPPRR